MTEKLSLRNPQVCIGVTPSSNAVLHLGRGCVATAWAITVQEKVTF